jgi:ABC-type nitrate/sulfonate/bicarbonate transport system permease component
MGATVADRGPASVTPQPRRRFSFGIPLSLERGVLGLSGIIVFVALWQAILLTGAVSPLLLPSPAATATAFVDLFATGEIWPHLVSSLRLLGFGFAFGAVAGISLGIVAGWFGDLRAAMSPHVAILYATPTVALMPLFIIWFGLGLASQLVVVILLSFFSCYYAGIDAVQTTDRNLIRVARVFGATQRHIFRTIVLPGSVPHVLSGMRIALGKAIVGMMVVELYAAPAGLGYLLIFYGNRFKMGEVFSIILIIAIVGLASRFILGLAEHRFDAWRHG